MTQPVPMAMHRRDFLKLSATSAALLAAGAATATLAGCAGREPAAVGYVFLRADDLLLFAALAPVVLAASLPAQNREAHITALLLGIDATCMRLLAPSQKALYQLFDLLNTGLTRRLTTGVSKPWAEADAAEIDGFLQRWSASGIGLFNSGYRGLVKLIAGAWLANPEGYKFAGYPGPWQPMFDAVHAS